VSTPEPTSLPKDGDEEPFEDDLDAKDDTPAEPEDESVTEEKWVRVNDKAPIWMR
jgi:heat shock protein beta